MNSRLERGLERLRMQVVIAGLPWRTLASLCGSADHEDMAAYAAAWQEWLSAQAGHVAWPDWQSCHEDFVSHLYAHTIGFFDLGEEGAW